MSILFGHILPPSNLGTRQKGAGWMPNHFIALVTKDEFAGQHESQDDSKKRPDDRVEDMDAIDNDTNDNSYIEAMEHDVIKETSKSNKSSIADDRKGEDQENQNDMCPPMMQDARLVVNGRIEPSTSAEVVEHKTKRHKTFAEVNVLYTAMGTRVPLRNVDLGPKVGKLYVVDNTENYKCWTLKKRMRYWDDYGKNFC
jgi:hypothetical protein